MTKPEITPLHEDVTFHGPLSEERAARLIRSLAPLDGARVLVNVVVNLEHWSLDAPMPRAALPAPQGLAAVPDVANHSWVLYGLRAGLPRLAQEVIGYAGYNAIPRGGGYLGMIGSRDPIVLLARGDL